MKSQISRQLLSVEEAFLQLMTTPEGRKLAYLCYYEWDVLNACRRFEASEEWQEVVRLIEPVGPRQKALDLGAGNGIASYALARLGFSVIAVEPNPSRFVGYGALKTIADGTMFDIEHSDAFGENLPLEDDCFDCVYARQVLHHARDLEQIVAEMARVLKPGGLFLACREHVVDDQKSLERFFESHPIHQLTDGEGAFTLDEYTQAIEEAGLTLCQRLGPWDTVINHYPTTNTELKDKMVRQSWRRYGKLGALLAHLPGWERWYRRKKTANDRMPGRMYTFVARKPRS